VAQKSENSSKFQVEQGTFDGKGQLPKTMSDEASKTPGHSDVSEDMSLSAMAASRAGQSIAFFTSPIRDDTTMSEFQAQSVGNTLLSSSWTEFTQDASRGYSGAELGHQVCMSRRTAHVEAHARDFGMAMGFYSFP
jgi:hypothetical protein